MENLDQLLSFFSTEFHNDESQHQTERGVLNQGYMNKTADHIPIDILNYINNHPFVLEANVMNRQALPFLEHSLDTNAQHMHISQENTETHIDTNLSNGNIGIPLHFLDTSNTANAQPPPVLTANVDGNGRDSEAISRPNAQKSTSNYLGVSKHCHTEKFEAHIWDSSFIKEGGKRKGRQVYLGSYENEEEAARSYDLAAIKFRGPATTTNFPLSHYEKDMEKMMQMTTNDYVTFLRRKSCGFARGKSEYRGVTRSRSNGKWQARIGRVYKNKDLYLGAFDREEDAAEAYDVAAIRFRGLKALTNFDPRRYNIPENIEANHIFSCNNATSKDHNVVINKESVANETSQFLPSLEARTSSSVGYTNNHGSGWNSHPLSHDQNSSTHLVEMVGTSTSSDLGLGDIDKASFGLLDLLDMSDNIILPFEINPGAEFGSAALLNLPYVLPHKIGQDLTVRAAIEARDMDYSQNLPWYHNPSFFSENGDFDSNTSGSQL